MAYSLGNQSQSMDPTFVYAATFDPFAQQSQVPIQGNRFASQGFNPQGTQVPIQAPVENKNSEGQDEWVDKVYKRFGCEAGARCCLSQCAMSIANIAVLVIGALAVAGVFPGSSATLGWTMVGLGAGIVLFQVTSGDPKKRWCQNIIALVTAAVLVGVGGGGISGALTTHQLGIAALTTSLVGVGCFNSGYYGSCYCVADYARNGNEQEKASSASTDASAFEPGPLPNRGYAANRVYSHGANNSTGLQPSGVEEILESSVSTGSDDNKSKTVPKSTSADDVD